uniref:Uncharacterized protein n=1 Tax=Opuntia streptacantha TaxID=393608 RepID=A0A7C9B1R9_OPUST
MLCLAFNSDFTGGSDALGASGADVLLQAWVLHVLAKARLLLPQFGAARRRWCLARHDRWSTRRQLHWAASHRLRRAHQRRRNDHRHQGQDNDLVRSHDGQAMLADDNSLVNL